MDQVVLAEPEQEAPQRRKPGGPVVTALLALVTLGFLVWAALPLTGLDTNRYTIALVALTPYAALVGIVLALLALVLRRWLTVVVVGLVTAALVYFVAPRVIPDERLLNGAPLRVLSVNTYFGQADAEQIVDLVRRNNVDVLSLQELTPELVSALDRAGLAELMPHRVFQPGPKADGSGIASRHPLQPLSLVPPSTLAQPSARVSHPVVPDVEFVAVHPFYPMGRDTAEVWAREIAALPEPLHEGTLRVLAGDFNATLDHTRLKDLLGRGYADAAEVTGNGLSPTWPGPGSWFPPPVTIDHILTCSGFDVRSYETFDITGTDHHAVFAELLLPVDP